MTIAAVSFDAIVIEQPESSRDLHNEAHQASSTWIDLTNHHQTEEQKPMNRSTIKRILVAIGVAAGFLSVTAGHATAAMNHSEPTLARS